MPSGLYHYVSLYHRVMIYDVLFYGEHSYCLTLGAPCRVVTGEETTVSNPAASP